MNKILFHRIVIVGLIVVNLLLFNRLLNDNKRPEHGGHRGPKDLIIKKLNFDEKQVAEYENLIDQHQQKINELDERMINIKHGILSQLTEDNPNIQDGLYQRIGTIQTEVETAHFEHFLAIKSICTEEQLDDFEELTKQLAELFNKRKRRDLPPQH